MERVMVLKIACALAGVGLFAYGVRSEDNVVRWVGIAFVIVAFLLRFLKKRAPDESP
jgi:Na+(H+)/acetate symporter ActP